MPRGLPRRTLRVAVLAAASLSAIAGCSSEPTVSTGSTGPSAEAAPQVASIELSGSPVLPGAMLAEADGSVLVGDRLTGRILRVDPAGAAAPQQVDDLDVRARTDDQRGLLGLARTPDGRLFASWTRESDGRLVVGEVGMEEPRLVWEGPVSADAANGGRLVVADGALVVGIGDLLADRDLADDTTVPNRKVLALDPDGVSSQRPRILSAGWNNPFALTVDAEGVVWVADNTGGEGPERLGRVDRPANEARPLGGPGPGERAPSGLVALDGRFGVCGYLSGQVDELRADGEAGAVLARPCRTAVVRLADGRLAMGTDTGVSVTLEPID